MKSEELQRGVIKFQWLLHISTAVYTIKKQLQYRWVLLAL